MQDSAWLAGTIKRYKSMGMMREYPAIGVKAIGTNIQKKKEVRPRKGYVVLCRLGFRVVVGGSFQN